MFKQLYGNILKSVDDLIEIGRTIVYCIYILCFTLHLAIELSNKGQDYRLLYLNGLFYFISINNGKIR